MTRLLALLLTIVVQVPVLVRDKSGNAVSNLTQEDFTILEDKVPQQISSFKHEDVPLSVGLVIDNSGSMRKKRERVSNAAVTFVRESNPDDETFIISFDDSAHVAQEMTGSIGDLIDALDNFASRGETALFDAIDLAINKVSKQGRREFKALLLISDGVDNRSRTRYEDVLKKLKDSNVTLFAIGLSEEDETRGFLRTPPAKKAQEALSTLAQATGGEAFFPKSLDEVEVLCKQIARDLRNRYVLSYSSTSTKQDGMWHEVKVTVAPAKAAAAKLDIPRHRPGYFATGPR